MVRGANKRREEGNKKGKKITKTRATTMEQEKKKETRKERSEGTIRKF